MSAKRKSIWTNGWVQGVGTTLIAYLFTDVIFKANIFGKAFNWLFASLKTKYNISMWVIVIVVLVLALLVVAVLNLATINNSRASAQKPHWTTYTQDTFNDRFDGILIKWSWSRVMGGYEFDNPRFCCPKDECELHNNRCPVCDSFYNTSHINMDVVHKLIDNKLEKMTSSTQ